jgi:hypothetical protein
MNATQKALPATAEEICDIAGSVSGIRQVNKSPLADGSPTTMGVVQEVHVSIVLDERVPHDRSRDHALCGAAKGAQVTYKLCSPTQIRAGDRIRGTEGLMIVDPAGMGCLFDVAVLPKT